MAKSLGEKVLENCAKKLKPYLRQALKSLGAVSDDYSVIVASICEGLNGLVDQSDVHTVRIESCTLMSGKKFQLLLLYFGTELVVEYPI